MATDNFFSDHPHRRFDPLRDQWVLVSPHRNKRPWQGKVDISEDQPKPSYDDNCYLCPGNDRAHGNSNPEYEGVYIFPNDFSALLPDTPAPEKGSPLFRAEQARGEARVMCFSPDHSKTIAEFSIAEIVPIVEAWCDQLEELGARYKYVQIFETKGAILGSSNPHPHGQIWASDHWPQEVIVEDRTQAAWHSTHGRSMLLQLAEEESGGKRVIFENDHWLSIVPFWADWPFETLLLPKFPVSRMPDLTAAQRASLAEAIHGLVVRYDNLFECSFPYLMGWHGAPHDLKNDDYWQLHAHYYPPLLRSASVQKFKAGYEALAEAQRDMTAEQAAQKLRDAGGVHYRGNAA